MIAIFVLPLFIKIYQIKLQATEEAKKSCQKKKKKNLMFMCFIVANNLQSHVMKMIFLENYLTTYFLLMKEKQHFAT